TLNAAIRALLPDVISITRGQAKHNPRAPWLLSRVPIDVRAIQRIAVAWAQSTSFAHADEGRRLRAAQQVASAPLAWVRADLRASPWTTTPTGTASAPRDSLGDPFRLLPELLAAHITARMTQEGRAFEFGDSTPEVRRATLPDDQSGVELVSWPPEWSRAGTSTWPYSFVITLTVQTVPFERAPLLYADLSVRRWVAGRIGASKATVYLTSAAPWIEDAPSSPYFGIAEIARQYHAATKTWEWDWGNALPSILDRLKRLGIGMRP